MVDSYTTAVQTGLKSLHDSRACIEELEGEARQLSMALQEVTGGQVTCTLVRVKHSRGRSLRIINTHGEGSAVFILDLAENGYPIRISAVLREDIEGTVVTARDAEACKNIEQVKKVLCRWLQTSTLGHIIEGLAAEVDA